MKKLLFLIVSVFMFSSCGVYKPAPKSFIGVMDYSTLTQQGIFVTESNSVSFDYEPIGSIVAEETGGWVYKNDTPMNQDPKDDYYIGSHNKKIYQAPNVQVAFANLASRLKDINANGIVNLKVVSTLELDQTSKLSVQKITITGMAIRK